MRRVDLSDTFAVVVMRLRIAKGFSKTALAQNSGLHQTYIGLVERGERNPSLDTANALAYALGVPLSEMIREAEELAKRGAKGQEVKRRAPRT